MIAESHQVDHYLARQGKMSSSLITPVESDTKAVSDQLDLRAATSIKDYLMSQQNGHHVSRPIWLKLGVGKNLPVIGAKVVTGLPQVRISIQRIAATRRLLKVSPAAKYVSNVIVSDYLLMI